MSRRKALGRTRLDSQFTKYRQFGEKENQQPEEDFLHGAAGVCNCVVPVADGADRVECRSGGSGHAHAQAAVTRTCRPVPGFGHAARSRRGPMAEQATSTVKDGVIHVCPLSAVPALVERAKASHLITLLQKEILVERPRTILPDRHLRLPVHDIAEERFDQIAPGEQHMSELIAFARDWGGRGPMVVHCWAGISRSTAAAFTALCVINPELPEDKIARALRDASPTAHPNRLM